MQHKQEFPAIFLDRDGVINYDDDYTYQIDKFRFIPGVFEACRILQQMNYKLIIITNQAGIARGYYQEQDYHLLTHWMLKQFKTNHIDISGVYYCPHHQEKGQGKYKQQCACRKPQPGMILQAARDHHIDLTQSMLVGDKLSDIQAGKNAGIPHNYLVKTGKPVTKEICRNAYASYDNLLKLANTIYSQNSTLNTQHSTLRPQLSNLNSQN